MKSEQDVLVRYLVLWQPMQALIVDSAPDPRQWPMVYATCMRDVLDVKAGRVRLGCRLKPRHGERIAIEIDTYRVAVTNLAGK
jgi:hypothetical protein